MDKRIIARVLMAPVLAVGLTGFAGAAYAQEDAYEITYTGAEHEFLAPGAEIFSAVNNGVPGDTFAGSLMVDNASDNVCQAFLQTQDIVTNGPDDMLDRVPFVIEMDGEALFEGMLGDADSREPLSLGEIDPAGAKTVECVAVIPADLTNEYADAAVGLNMKVTVNDRDDGDGTGLVQTSAAGAGAGAGLAQTGDWLIALAPVLGLLTAAGAVTWCAWKKRMNMW